MNRRRKPKTNSLRDNMSFQKRALSGPETLGLRLRSLREERRVTLEELAKTLAVNVRYLAAIEASRYQELPGLVYARNFTRLYVQWAGLNLEAAMERFRQEYAVVQAVRPTKRPLLAQRANTEIPWWRRHTRLLVAIFFVLLAIGYFGWQVYRLYAPASLVVTEPATDIATASTSIIVAGQTDPGATVRINSDDIEVDRSGHFRIEVELAAGLNTLKISASKPRAEDRVVTRQILRERGTEEPPADGTVDTNLEIPAE